MALEQWALPQFRELLPLEEQEIKQIITYSNTLSDEAAAQHLRELLGDSPEAIQFIGEFNGRRAELNSMNSKAANDKAQDQDIKGTGSTPNQQNGGSAKLDQPPAYAPPLTAPPVGGSSRASARHHTNQVIEAAKVRQRDEQEMQQTLQNLQFQYNIFNSEIEPEHDTDYPCGCPIHQYQRMKWQRYGVQDMWSKAVMYPGEKAYNDNKYNVGQGLFSGNPYNQMRVVSPYGYQQWSPWGMQRPIPGYHARFIHQTIDLNNSLNRKAQDDIDAKEPKHSIWEDNALETAMTNLSMGDKKRASVSGPPSEKRQSINEASSAVDRPKTSKMSSFRKSIGIKTSEERAVGKLEKAVGKGNVLRDEILAEEQGRWPDEAWRNIVAVYQEKVGMAAKIADLRARYPIQYLRLLRAGYFEPIPVAWASQLSNPLKFSIEAGAGWRGITPAWRGYEDTAEERLYWVLNHREGTPPARRLKPDFISALNMARERMQRAVPPPPGYYDANDTCHTQHTSEGYSKQVPPPPFQAFDRPEVATDDTMILLDVSGSMDFVPVRPVYDQYLVSGWTKSTQPKNKDTAKAIIRRFTDAMANHDHQFSGYDMFTFSTRASYVGSINHRNLDQMWRQNVRLGGGTRVMTGWQQVKERHFQKHSESATYHPVYGWQAGPETPMLRLLLLLDGEANDMDEFELDLLGLSWAHVTIFLIGVDGCPHHHRHANELQRISDVNHHVSFVDAQGNAAERYVTHELLKRHLGYDITMSEFEEMEQLPAYTE